MGQQLLDQLQPRRPRPRHRRRQLPAHARRARWSATTLRARYPDMEIEDCASGANRLSLDMLAYTDASWVSDRTSPSSRVRHNLEGLIDIFPAPYLLTFAIQTTDGADDRRRRRLTCRRSMRSRMPGAVRHERAHGRHERRHAGRARAAHRALQVHPADSARFGARCCCRPQQIDLPDVPWSGWDVIAARVAGDGRCRGDGVRHAGRSVEHAGAAQGAQDRTSTTRWNRPITATSAPCTAPI